MDKLRGFVDLVFAVGIRDPETYHSLVQAWRFLNTQVYRTKLVQALTVVVEYHCYGITDLIEHFPGDTAYWVLGRLHREERGSDGRVLPAMFDNNGVYKIWCRHGQHFRDDRDENGYLLPTLIAGDGAKIWCNEHGEKHRDEVDALGNKLPAIIWDDGSREWWENDRVIMSYDSGANTWIHHASKK